MRVVTLFVRYGAEKYARSLVELDRFFIERLPAAERELVVIDNAIPDGHQESIERGRILIGGDNTAWEFSAWNKGVAFLGERLNHFDFVHLATSAFGELYTSYITRFSYEMLASVLGRAVAVGHIDRYNEPVEVIGWRCQSWLRTSFMFLPPTELRLLGSLVSLNDRDAFFSGDPRAPFRDDGPLSAGYRENILGWLTGAGTGQGTTWHSRFDLTEESLPMFEAKALAILNEQMLSARLRAQGCAIVDATWLSTELNSRPRRNERVLSMPHWREQIAGRDIDAVPLDPSW